MVYTFRVVVETDDTHLDAPDATSIKNEIVSNLEYDALDTGIVFVDVALQKKAPADNYRYQVERSLEQ